MGFALEKTYTAKTIERKMYKLSIKIFNSFKRQVMKNLKKADKTFKKHLKKQMPLAAIDIIMPDIGDVQHKWENTFEPFLEEEYQEVGNTALRKLRKRMKKYQYETKEAEDIFNVANPMTAQTIKNQMNKIVGASDKVYTKLKDEMMIDLLNGENIQKIQDTVTNVMGKAPMEAMRIARTESNRVANLGTFHSYETEDLVIGYEWLTLIDDGTRKSHIEMNGTRKKKGETFGNGMMFPMDEAASAGEVVNCRCTALPLLDDKELAEGLPEEVVAVEAPQVKPTGAGAKWNTTNKDEAKWHNKSEWGNKTPRQKQFRTAIDKADTLSKVTRLDDGSYCYYGNRGINMSKGLKIGKPMASSTWRHEFGHFIDDDEKFTALYAKKLLKEMDELPDDFAANFFNPESMEAGYKYSISRSRQISKSMGLPLKDDLKSLRSIDKKAGKANKFIKGDAKFYGNESYKTWEGIQEINLKELKKIGLDENFNLTVSKEKFRKNMIKLYDENPTFVKIKDLEEITGVPLDAIDFLDNKDTIKNLLSASSGNTNEQLNLIYRIVADGAGDSVYLANYDALCDFIGAMSREQFGGKGRKSITNLIRRYGHGASYYTEGTKVIYGINGHQTAEMFANYTDMVTSMGVDDGVAWHRLMSRVAPKATKQADDIMDFISEVDTAGWKELVK
tara:strand:+ start:1803 stop:3827 length:2025 start_codon:yes stop_codon:yes gene_type:complete